MVLTNFLKRMGSDSRGATAVEYGLIVSLIVLAMVGALQSVADANNAQWDYVSEEVDTVMGN